VSQLLANADITNGDVSVVLLWFESFTVTGSVIDGASTRYAVGETFPATTGSVGYRLDLPDGFNRVVASLVGAAGNPGGTDIDLYLTRNRVVVAASAVAGDDEQFVLGAMPGGLYELWAYGHTVVPLSVGYTLAVTGAVPVHVSRVYPDGTSAELLGSPVIPGLSDGYATLWDTVGPLDVPVYYRATDPLTHVTLTSNTVTVTGQGDGWLRDPSVPYNDVHLTDCSKTCPVPTPNFGGGITQVVLDAYSRTVTGGWGTADSGQLWTVQAGAAADFSTNGNQGQISVSATNTEKIITSAASVVNGDVRFDVQVPAPTGNAINAYAIARFTSTSNYYRARLAFNADRTVSVGVEKVVATVVTVIAAQVVQPGVFHIPGMFFRLRFQVDGDTLRVKTWTRGTDEPVDWTTSVVDTSLTTAGNIGVRALLTTGVTNTLPVVYLFEDLSLLTYTIPSQVGPDIDRRAIFQGLDAEGYDSASGVFDVVDGFRTRNVAQRRRGPSSSLRLLTQQLTQLQAMQIILAAGRTLFIQLAAVNGWAYGNWSADYVNVDNVIEGRLSVNNMPLPERTWQLPFRIGRAPGVSSGHIGGNGLGPVGKAYYDEIINGATYQDEITAGGTYLQASLGQVT
jgi:hypothetical protein